MKKKTILLVISVIVLVFPIYFGFQLLENLSAVQQFEILENNLRNYQLCLWLVWVLLVVLAIYFKWTEEKNFFFYFVYTYIVVGFGFLGLFAQEITNYFSIPTGFEDDYSFGVFYAFQNLIAAGILTGTLQACVWWFTRRWHRRM